MERGKRGAWRERLGGTNAWEERSGSIWLRVLVACLDHRAGDATLDILAMLDTMLDAMPRPPPGATPCSATRDITAPARFGPRADLSSSRQIAGTEKRDRLRPGAPREAPWMVNLSTRPPGLGRNRDSRGFAFYRYCVQPARRASPTGLQPRRQPANHGGGQYA